MNILVIGKPTYNVVLPINSFLVENTKNEIPEKFEMGGGSSFYAAKLLGKWNLPVSYAGVIGSDLYGNKIKSELEQDKVNTKFLEINYEHPTSFNYIILNKNNGSSTQIIKDNKEINLTKYKYDFIPDYIIMDGTDPSGSIAALNNFPAAKSILLASKVSESLYGISKRCTYVVANTVYAEALTKMKLELNKGKSVVNFMQKIKDLHKPSYIVTLGSSGVLYVSDNQVKILPAQNVENIIDDTNASSVFFGAFCYGIINNYNIDDVVKLASIAASLSLTKIGSANSIPELAEVLSVAGLKEESFNKEEIIEEESNAPQLPKISEEEVPSVSVSV